MALPAWTDGYPSQRRSDGLIRAASAIPLAAIDRKLIEKADESLWEFTRMCFSIVDPATFKDGQHLHMVCEHLQAVSEGKITRLIVNIPPGFMKSLLCCVFWPTWHWIKHNPSSKWFFGSYDASLTKRDAKRSIDLILSRWFIDRFGLILEDSDPAVTEFYTKDKGSRFASSVGGKATGRHFDIQVVDDPIKPKDALGGATLSDAMLTSVISWWRNTMATRVTDPVKTARVIIMQRLHERDLAGAMIEEGGYEHLRLPMKYEPKFHCKTMIGEDWRKEEDEKLWPARFDDEGIKIQEKDLGSAVAIAAQHQQRPTPAAGLIFKEDEIRYWHIEAGKLDPKGRPCKVPPISGGIALQSWDMTFKKSDGTDFVAGGVWLRNLADFFLLDQKHARMSFTDACKAVLSMRKTHPRATRILIEDKANGPAVEDQLKSKVAGITLVDPKGGKIARANAVQPFFETSNVYIPHPDLAPWVPEYVKELIGFPFAKHDDQVDQTSQALLYLNNKASRLQEAMRKVSADP